MEMIWKATKKGSKWGRFGAGWDWKLGIAIGTRIIAIDYLFGTCLIQWNEKKEVEENE